ncbi:hypothetical protein [Burkholderia pseudomultivorans]|uniref:hypothetical protein n=1 Tax=Burkholderia pseudomultivorans TaxID=1207504 RepID=UPI000754FCC5|nr:hypothetical protein [Burkholderia pseudomultivorans]KVG63057.1 hypothetical protein WS80_22920 [Burkholderia pseudomultivorans]
MMQRRVLQAVCRPGRPDASRTRGISFQTTALPHARGAMRAADANRTARGAADRLERPASPHDNACEAALAHASHCPASVQHTMYAQRFREAERRRVQPPSRAARGLFRAPAPSRGYDACRPLQPAFDCPPMRHPILEETT